MSGSEETTSDESVRLEEFFANPESNVVSLKEIGDISQDTGIPLRNIECFALGKGLIPLRYQRNIGTLGVEGQITLLKSAALVIGLGGLGGSILEQIARLGFGTIIGVDPDVFDETNLNRQILSSEDAIGREKAAVAEERVQKINSAVSFTGHVCKLQDLPDGVWHSADMVFDCLDSIPDRLILADKCARADCPLIHGAIGGWYSEVGVVWPGSTMLETIYQGQSEGLEKELGTPVCTAMMTATIMAAKAGQIMTGRDLSKESKMHFFNLLDHEWQIVTMEEDDHE